MQVLFEDPILAQQCNRGEGSWGDATEDVLLALSVLSHAASVEIFDALPNVRRERGVIVFGARTSQVRLGLANAKGGGVVVKTIDATVQLGS